MLSNSFGNNSTNVSMNMSETHLYHTNLSRRIFWCVCQLLVVAQKLKLMNSINTSMSVCHSNIIQEFQKCQISDKKQQWYPSLICSKIVSYILISRLHLPLSFGVLVFWCLGLFDLFDLFDLLDLLDPFDLLDLLDVLDLFCLLKTHLL